MKISELHDQLFSVLCIVDDICRQEKVRYFLDSGTAIGAAREKGFVPWDDDVDIKVLREDYPAFRDAMKKHLPEHLHFVEPQEYAPGFYDFIPRVYDDRLPLREETEQDRYYKNFQNRVGLDVFIFDKVPDSTLAQKRLLLSSKILYGMGMSKRYRIDYSKYTPMQRLMVGVLCLLGKPFSTQWICRQWNRIAASYQNKPAKWRFPSNFQLEQQFFFPAELYEGTVYLPFRDRQLPMISGYDGELTQLYGDYMHPPKDKDAFIKHAQLED